MNSNKKNLAKVNPARLNGQAGAPSKFKPVVAQFKTAGTNPAVAPPVYRPQTVPKVLQLKRHEVKKMGGIVVTQNAAGSSLLPAAPPKILQKKVGPNRPDVHRHQVTTTNRTTQPSGHAKPCCVQAKANRGLRNNSLASVPKPRFANVGRPGRSIQLAAKAKAAPMEVEAVEAESKDDVKKALLLNDIAKKLHAAGGGTGQNTTGVALLTDGRIVAATQLSPAKLSATAALMGVADVSKTKGAGFHCEVSLYIDYGALIQAVSASQGFCPHCQEFLNAKGIKRVGPDRDTNDQVWYSPERYYGKEKDPIGAAYPWAYEKDPVEQVRVTYKTKAAYAAQYKARTGSELPW